MTAADGAAHGEAGPEMPVTTILERMTTAGIDQARAREHIVGGRVRVDGTRVTDPGASAPWPARWVVAAST